MFTMAPGQLIRSGTDAVDKNENAPEIRGVRGPVLV